MDIPRHYFWRKNLGVIHAGFWRDTRQIQVMKWKLVHTIKFWRGAVSTLAQKPWNGPLEVFSPVQTSLQDHWQTLNPNALVVLIDLLEGNHSLPWWWNRHRIRPQTKWCRSVHRPLKSVSYWRVCRRMDFGEDASWCQTPLLRRLARWLEPCPYQDRWTKLWLFPTEGEYQPKIGKVKQDWYRTVFKI